MEKGRCKEVCKLYLSKTIKKNPQTWGPVIERYGGFQIEVNICGRLCKSPKSTYIYSINVDLQVKEEELKEIRKYFELSRNETPFSNMKNVIEFLVNTKHSTTVLDIVILFFPV